MIQVMTEHRKGCYKQLPLCLNISQTALTNAHLNVHVTQTHFSLSKLKHVFSFSVQCQAPELTYILDYILATLAGRNNVNTNVKKMNEKHMIRILMK